MREIRTSGSMSGEGKRSDAEWPKLPRPSSTLLRETEFGLSSGCEMLVFGDHAEARSRQVMTQSEADV